MDAEQFHKPPTAAAIKDYLYLMNNGYPEKGSLKLVGDKFQLTRDQRTVLYRGVSAAEKIRNRKKRKVSHTEDILVIDGYNVLFTLLNYRAGRFVFLCLDGFCRDAGAMFGRIRHKKLFEECVTLLAENLPKKAKKVVVYLDSPVSHSAEHKALLTQAFMALPYPSDIELVHSADTALLTHTKACLATSDSAIIDHCENPIIDLPAAILSGKFNAQLYDLSSALA